MNILVYGIGKSGLSVVKFANTLGWRSWITDDFTRLVPFRENVTFVEPGKIDNSFFVDHQIDLVIKSPGIPPNKPIVLRATALGIPVIDEVELACRFIGTPYIAVTGTNGKSTVVQWINDILSWQGLKVAIAGNFGTPLIEFVGKNFDLLALELSSFQLAFTFSLKPKVAVVTNITSDHIDWHSTREKYLKAKFSIFSNRESLDCIVVGDSIAVSSSETPLKRVGYGDDIYEGIRIKNGLLLEVEKGTVVDTLFIPKTFFFDELLAFSYLASKVVVNDLRLGDLQLDRLNFLEHRLQVIGKLNGALWVNDSKATNTAATSFAVEKLSRFSKIRLLLGGRSKESSFDQLAAFIKDRVIKCYLFGEDREKIGDSLDRFGISYESFVFLEDAVCSVARDSTDGDIVLFSPGCASFDLYSNYKERGEHFIKLARKVGNVKSVSL